MPLVTSHPTGQPIWFDLQTRDAAAARGSATPVAR
jgi:hypothetical protein